MRPEQKILHNAEIIGQHYAHCCGENNETALTVQEAYRQTINEVVGLITQYRGKNRMVGSAMYELLLLTEVDRALIELDTNHAEASLVQINSRGNGEIKAKINGIKAEFGAIGLDSHQEFKQVYEVTSAQWRFEPNGVRLNIKYVESSTQKEHELSARMDFHMRPILEASQGALDLEGKYLDVLAAEIGDHHYGHFLDGVLNQELMDQIRTQRFAEVAISFQADLYQRNKGKRSTPSN